MSNRLECEFPAQRWQAVPPIRRDPAGDEVVRMYLARGHELRSEAFRRTGRRGLAAARSARACLPGRRAAGRLTATGGSSFLAGARYGRSPVAA
jgi:hypothetical protein